MNILKYIWHDCFFFESDNLSIVFDFWIDPLESNDELPLFLNKIDKQKPLYVLVSHHHKDHYTKKIFEWEKRFEHVKFIISKDVAISARHILCGDSIYKGFKPSTSSVVVLKPGEKYLDNLLNVEAFGSTDIGNSYAVTLFTGETIFHAGDLNAWIWKDESTEAEVNEELEKFNKILDDVYDAHKSFDYCMFPVDSRIGSEYYTGAKIFVRRFDVRRFFPMHFGLGDPDKEQKKYRFDAAQVENYANRERGEYICLQAPYSVYAVNG